MQQRKYDGKIWISPNWLYRPDCYGSGEGFGIDIYRALYDAAEDKKNAEKLWQKYKEIIEECLLGLKKA